MVEQSYFVSSTTRLPTIQSRPKIRLQTIRIWCKFASLNNITMARQSISFSKPNDEWLKALVDNQEYSSKSEIINDLIRQARKQQVQIDWIRAKLDKAENSGFTKDTKEQILKQSKSMLNG
jgi:antitoxin ParD1/3/4